MIRHRIAIAALAWLVSASAAVAQTSSFSYQGKLTDSGTVANGPYDFQFALWDSAAAGNQVGTTQTVANVAVSNGVFTVTLDFGANSFPGADRFLEIAARSSGGGSFSLLTPRQQVTSSPYAVRSANAASANALSTSCVGCITNTQIANVDASKLTGTIPLAVIPTADGSFIHNSTTAQPGNFNLSGSGTVSGVLTAGSVNAATEFDIGGVRALSIDVNHNSSGGGAGAGGVAENASFGFDAGRQLAAGRQNSLFGANAGRALVNGNLNTFFGAFAGQAVISTAENTFVGFDAGVETTGGANTFVGSSAGEQVTTGFNNAFFGINAGKGTATHQSSASNNAFFGAGAGLSIGLGGSNTLVGTLAGASEVDGDSNTLVGANAGTHMTDAIRNTYIGVNTGLTDTFGDDNTLLGAQANVGAAGLSHATAIGAGSVVRTSETIVLGRETGFDHVVIFGLGTGGNRQLCRNNTTHEIANCSSSLRYKSNVAGFAGGLSVIDRLRPISYDWKSDGSHDVGFAAEEVAAIDPRFVTYDDAGAIEGVKYDRLGTVFVNAIREQQAEIERLREQLRALTALACASHPEAPACRAER